jgi:cysteine synthase
MDRSVLSLLAANGARLTTVPEGTALVSLLRQVARASAAADASYAAWVKDLEATGCYSAPTNDLYYQRATHESVTAATALKRVDALWATVGGRPTSA